MFDNVSVCFVLAHLNCFPEFYDQLYHDLHLW